MLSSQKIALAAPPQKIVGGTIARNGEFPYQVSIRKYGHHFCGGSIIDKQYILTAAHCAVEIPNPPTEEFTVVTGTNTLSDGGQESAIAEVTTHPEYTPGQENSWHNDIAVLKVKFLFTKKWIYFYFSFYNIKL